LLRALTSATICPYLEAELAFFTDPWAMRIPSRIRLQLGGTRVIDVVVAVITAEGESSMNGIPEKDVNNAAGTPSGEPTPAKRPRVAAHGRHVAPSKGRSATKATPAKKANQGAKSAKSPKKATGARNGSKTAKILDLLKRAGGATGKDLMKATGWQAHSVRGFISGVLGKKMGLTVASTKAADGERRYSLKS
jgi:hypothetical protein